MDAAPASRPALHSGIALARFVKAQRAMEQVQHLPPGPARTRKLSGLTVTGAVVSGLLASVCCIGPLLLAGLGIGGAGLLPRLAGFRPVFTAPPFASLLPPVWPPRRKPSAGAGPDVGGRDPEASRPG